MCDGGDTISVALANEAPAARSYTRRMSVRRLTPLLAAAALAAVPLAGAGAQAPSTPDQRFVAELKSARQAGQAAFRQLSPRSININKGRSSIDVMKKAKAEITSALGHLKSAAQAAPEAVGGSDPEIAASVSTATKLSAQAASQMRRADYNGARESIDLVLKASQAALTAFGVPLAKEFQATATYRELGNIQGWEEYLGLGAKVNAPIAKIVIGILGRPTANMGEAGGKKAAPSLPITKLAIYTLQEPSGAYSSGWGKIVNGIIVCDLSPTMKANESFAVSFGPRVEKGTKFLLKFWSTDGRRSYAVLTTK